MYFRAQFVKGFLMMIFLGMCTSICMAEVTTDPTGGTQPDPPIDLNGPVTSIEIEGEVPEADDPSETGNSTGGGSSQGSPPPPPPSTGGGKRAINRDDLRFDDQTVAVIDTVVYDRIETLWGTRLEATTVEHLGVLDDGQVVAVPRGSLTLRDTEGLPIWTLTIEGSGQAVPRRLMLDEDDRAYVVGSFNGTIVLGDRMLRAEGRSAFIAALDLSGEILWVNEIGGNGWTEITTLEQGEDHLIRVGGSHRMLTGQPNGPTNFQAGFSHTGNLITVALEDN